MPTVGLFGINSHACADPRDAARIAALAEELGYDSLWAGEHVVVPSPRVEPSPMDPDEPILDPLVALAHLAAHTEQHPAWARASWSSRSATRSCSRSRWPASTR